MSPDTQAMRREIRKLTLAIRLSNFLARFTPNGKGSHRA